MMAAVLVLLALAGAAGVCYWLVVVTEGAYLGSGAVAFLYDRGAASYDEIKRFDDVDDARALGLPLARGLRGTRRPLVLDVATGTGRVALTLLRSLEFEGSIVGLDLSKGMLQEAKRKAAQHQERVIWLWKDALDLPFVDDGFDAVCCVEALEFMAEPTRVLKEMTRVLRPGGLLLASNRRGLDALLMPRRAFSKDRLRAILAELSMTSVDIEQWQTYYDLVWARKEGAAGPRERMAAVGEVLRCPQCREQSLLWQSARIVCQGCGSCYPIQKGVVCMNRR
jgi:ubiquinone/menaquinone biosynthesis C-methylase UbiE